ncbi:hypothetical protein G6F70_007331 [Rhizopus microsporus]|nr:hypothetical protein G6F71_004771 [Rhizopus microsporus]KAG1196592.1 hypothetical protein G6F70_007331 [Rhizopus microsporus]KAG1208324.1 hypothetical protein G6F69_007322 [Rhizopus microsporus]
MGPLRFIGCRTSERNIKKYTNLIKSVVKPGVNASNILVNEQSLQSYGLQQIISSIDRNSNPRMLYQALDTGRICVGLADAGVLRALVSYYRRLSDNRSLVSINSGIKIAERL